MFLLCFGNGNFILIIVPINNLFVAKEKRSGGLEYKLLSKPLPFSIMFLTLPSHECNFLWQPALW